MLADSKPINVDEAKLALDLINKQKSKVSESVRMPVWLNMYFSILFSYVVFFDYLNTFLKMYLSADLVLYVIMIGSLFFWFKSLAKKGIKLKLFPKTKITVLMFCFGAFSAAFCSPIARFLHQQIHPIMSVIFILFIGSLLFYIWHKYPLSEVIPEGSDNAES